MTPFAKYLMSRSPRLTAAGAEKLASRIVAEKAASAAKKKFKREAAQLSLPIDATPIQSTTNQPDEVVDF